MLSNNYGNNYLLLWTCRRNVVREHILERFFKSAKIYNL